MQITSYDSRFAVDIADLYHRSVHAIDNAIYSKVQKSAWACTPPDYQMWIERLSNTKPYLAVVNQQIVGFIELELDGYIDCFYVAPEWQGQGCGGQLYRHAEHIAQERRFKRLYVEASYVARPVFEHYGFSVLKQNCVIRQNVELVNFSMQKQLGR
ncbi:GNAT family N-acetyltransferase [Candidatus Albibeggiatoa sp. nov. NOAA]|uniref:GNAT family N-acetyltransferase n=1 Tax=Candidatus Albibeggiatoa sp. nov. NOAA TaxID=3162724 RepID=UPI0033002791|nr:GNAT family N-acetyltransferase [Thiotrichaceae bacterium]